MKFASVLTLVAAAIVVSADTNGERLARGLPPKAPARRSTPVARAKKSTPSNTPGQCNTGTTHCCQSVEKSGHNNILDELLSLLHIDVDPETPCGMSCSPISFVGASRDSSCEQEPVCCEHNNYNGLVNVGCNPINV